MIRFFLAYAVCVLAFAGGIVAGPRIVAPRHDPPQWWATEPCNDGDFIVGCLSTDPDYCKGKGDAWWVCKDGKWERVPPFLIPPDEENGDDNMHYL